MPGFDGLRVPADADIWHMVQSFIKPMSAGAICPRDREIGCAYVDTLRSKDDAGKATALLSYAWGYKFAEVIAALETWTVSTGCNPKRTYFWVCSFCLNQHGINGLPRGDNIDPSDPRAAARLAKGFYDRIVGIGRMLPMLEPWDSPGYVKRAWCLFELYTAVTKRLKVEIILSASETARFRQAIQTPGVRRGGHRAGRDRRRAGDLDPPGGAGAGAEGGAGAPGRDADAQRDGEDETPGVVPVAGRDPGRPPAE